MKRRHFLEAPQVGRAQSSLSVSAVDCLLPTSQRPPSPALSTVTLTPGRVRNIDQDMEALRASRQDNPFIQRVIASRESLIDTLDEQEDSDHTNLMPSKELTIDLDMDPMCLPEMHEHMIRSPPPVMWPHSPNCHTFDFPHGDETLEVEVNNTGHGRPKSGEPKAKHQYDINESTSPLKSLKCHHQDVFSLLTPNSLRCSGEDSIHLMSDD